jgi:hypothetical protein
MYSHRILPPRLAISRTSSPQNLDVKEVFKHSLTLTPPRLYVSAVKKVFLCLLEIDNALALFQ